MNDLIKHIETTIHEYYTAFTPVTLENHELFKYLTYSSVKPLILQNLKKNLTDEEFCAVDIKKIEFICNLTESGLDSLLQLNNSCWFGKDYLAVFIGGSPSRVITTSEAEVIARQVHKTHKSMLLKYHAEYLHSLLPKNLSIPFKLSCIRPTFDIGALDDRRLREKWEILSESELMRLLKMDDEIVETYKNMYGVQLYISKINQEPIIGNVWNETYFCYISTNEIKTTPCSTLQKIYNYVKGN